MWGVVAQLYLIYKILNFLKVTLIKGAEQLEYITLHSLNGPLLSRSNLKLEFCYEKI